MPALEAHAGAPERRARGNRPLAERRHISHNDKVGRARPHPAGQIQAGRGGWGLECMRGRIERAASEGPSLATIQETSALEDASAMAKEDKKKAGSALHTRARRPGLGQHWYCQRTLFCPTAAERGGLCPAYKDKPKLPVTHFSRFWVAHCLRCQPS
jgi:hypothetical protein